MEQKEFDYINVIPLVDIMLVLLTIVLTTSTLIATGTLPIQLPQASGEHSEILKMKVIEIDKTGSIFMNSVPCCLNGLKKELAADDRKTPILIRADRKLGLQFFVDVLDLVKQLGFSRVSLETESS